MYYLAYGSNMSQARLQARVPAAEKIGLVELSGHQLTFNNASSIDGSGKCDALVTGNEENIVYAVLYQLPDSAKVTLDRYEGLGLEYRAAFIPVKRPDGKAAEALIYYATNLRAEMQPYHWYKEHVIQGARENSLPADYIAAIIAVKGTEDPDRERTAREMGIHS